MPNPEALILARVAIEAYNSWATTDTQKTRSQFVAAALERHMVLMGWSDDGGCLYGVQTLGDNDPPVYRITDKPKEG